MATATGRSMADHLKGVPLDKLPLPVRPFRPIPGHGLLTQFLSTAIGIKKLQDWWEVRQS
jgi:hypothetical protein